MDWTLILVSSFGFLLLLMATGLPIAFCLGVLGIIALSILFPKALDLVGIMTLTSNLNFVLIAIPLFILMGEVLSFSGLNEDLFDALQKWLRGVPGSLAGASVVMCAIFAALNGSTSATTAAVGTLSVPEMLRRGYNRSFATGTVVSAASLAILIPPSITMILYSSMSGVPVAPLFIAGVVPGIVVTGLMVGYTTLTALKNPSLAPRGAQASWRERFYALRRIWIVAILILLVLGSIYLGVASPTEAAGVGCFGAIIIALIYKALNWTTLQRALLNTVRITCMISLIMATGMLFSKLLTVTEVAKQMTAFVTGLAVSPWWIFMLVNILFIILGCIMDPVAIILVFTPLVAPIMSALGFNLLWYGVVFTILICIAQITPPVGYNLFVMKGIAPEIPLEDVSKGSIPFLIIYLVGIALLCFLPQLALWLPSTMF